jgi:protoporphyrin/coproporphyrin ferrochelatase
MKPMDNPQKKLAVILLNLGTPDEPSAPAIRRYLSEFLKDPRVVSIPRIIWLPILYCLILPLRPKNLVHKYQLVWGRFDGPIRNISRALAKKTENSLSRQHHESTITVSEAMTYGNPSLKSVVSKLQSNGGTEFLFLPLYPQYATATTAAAADQVNRAFADLSFPNFRFIREYHDHPAYIHAVTKSIEAYSSFLDEGALLLFSFHGIPLAQVQAQAENAEKADSYPDQCQHSAELIAHALGLSEDQWILTFQSRFGFAKWLQPYTSEVMAELPRKGTRKVLVVCPGFATDCLETLEEIKILNRNIFLEAGGEQFRYVKALNATEDHVKLMSALITEHLFADER